MTDEPHPMQDEYDWAMAQRLFQFTVRDDHCSVTYDPEPTLHPNGTMTKAPCYPLLRTSEFLDAQDAALIAARVADLLENDYHAQAFLKDKYMTDEPTDNIVNFSAQRFKSDILTDKSGPRDALVKALDDFDNPAIQNPEHIIICLGRNSNNGSVTVFYQAGSYHYHAQMGLLYEAGQSIRKSC